MKPTLDLYIGWEVAAIQPKGDEPWQWSIVLTHGDRRIEIENKSRRETIPPTGILGYRLGALSLSTHDTSVHFMGPGATKVTIGLMPTQYAILDPKYGGEAYPQWPEELEEAGISSHPEEGVSAPPADEWDEERKRLKEAQHVRQDNEQREWMEEDSDEA